MKQRMQTYRIRNGAGPQVNQQEEAEEHLLPTDFKPSKSIHPDDAMELLLPAGVGRAGRAPDEERHLPPLMDNKKI